jgi:histidinol dehydrogenase
MTKIVRQLNSQDADFSSALKKLLAFDAADDEAIDLAAAKILADVKARGDQAVLEYTQKFDRLSKEQAS